MTIGLAALALLRVHRTRPSSSRSFPAQLFEIVPGGCENDDSSSMIDLEGLTESHAKHGTGKSTLFVPATLEGKRTLVEGQAPTDIDRFKAWHMKPQYHAISHVSGTGLVSPRDVYSFEIRSCWTYVFWSHRQSILV